MQPLDPAAAPFGADDLIALLMPIMPRPNREEYDGRHDTDFAYEMVALTPRTALGLTPGLVLSDADRARPYLEMSGRRGIGVRADDLLDGLVARAGEEIALRRPDADPGARTFTVR